MREPTIARNYAETLVALAHRADALEGWGAMMDQVVDAVESDRRLALFLDSPRVSAREKITIVSRAFADRLPRPFVRFLQAVIAHHRQRLLSEIASEYHSLVDGIQNRVHAEVTLVGEPDAAEAAAIAGRLGTALGKTVVPHFRTRPEILGGAIVRVGDTVMDGSVRRRLALLRARMLGAAR